MDKMYLQATICRIEEEKDLHDEKFAGMEIHANCLGRFEAAVAKLRTELEKLETSVAANPTSSGD